MSGDVYELQIGISHQDTGVGGFKIEHRFAELPDIETITALRDEAMNFYTHLFPDLEATVTSVYVMRLANRERRPQDEEIPA